MKRRLNQILFRVTLVNSIWFIVRSRIHFTQNTNYFMDNENSFNKLVASMSVCIKIFREQIFPGGARSKKVIVFSINANFLKNGSICHFSKSRGKQVPHLPPPCGRLLLLPVIGSRSKYETVIKKNTGGFQFLGGCQTLSFSVVALRGVGSK